MVLFLGNEPIISGSLVKFYMFSISSFFICCWTRPPSPSPNAFVLRPTSMSVMSPSVKYVY